LGGNLRIAERKCELLRQHKVSRENLLGGFESLRHNPDTSLSEENPKVTIVEEDIEAEPETPQPCMLVSDKQIPLAIVKIVTLDTVSRRKTFDFCFPKRAQLAFNSFLDSDGERSDSKFSARPG
jgi:hypothetical protein